MPVLSGAQWRGELEVEAGEVSQLTTGRQKYEVVLNS